MTDPFEPTGAGVDAAAFRQVLGHFPTGVTIITAMHDGAPAGLAVGSFFSVSLEPALIGFSAAQTSTSFPTCVRRVASAPTCWPPTRRRCAACSRAAGATSSRASAGGPRLPRARPALRCARLDRLHHRDGPRGRRPRGGAGSRPRPRRWPARARRWCSSAGATTASGSDPRGRVPCGSVGARQRWGRLTRWLECGSRACRSGTATSRRSIGSTSPSRTASSWSCSARRGAARPRAAHGRRARGHHRRHAPHR